MRKKDKQFSYHIEIAKMFFSQRSVEAMANAHKSQRPISVKMRKQVLNDKLIINFITMRIELKIACNARQHLQWRTLAHASCRHSYLDSR